MIQEFLGSTNFVGRDGFYWWIGQVETEKGEQQKGDDRYKVRIVGQHLKDCNAVAYDDLPWAIVMMPPTAPRREGGGDYTSVKYKAGDWVIGFFLDGREGQQPVIIGSIGQQYKASTTHVGKDKPAEKCLAFTTFLERDINPSTAVPATEQDKLKQGGLTGAGASTGTDQTKQPDLNGPVNNKNETASAALLATRCCNSETNPGGQYFCVEVSDAKCDTTDNDQSRFEKVLSELFANIQSSDGQIGTQIVSQYTGKLYDYVGIANEYVGKLAKLGNSLVARVKGEIFALIKQGAKEILNFLLTEEVIDTEATEAAKKAATASGKDPKEVQPVKKRVGRLRGITAWINDQLKNVNCVMEDLDQRLREFLEDLIFGALETVFNSARCFVSQLVNDIFNQIAAFLEDALNSILGPLQSLLAVIASPFDILGTAIAQLFDILGITCGGPTQSCASKEQTSNCTGPCGDSSDNQNFLDELINAIEDGNLDTSDGNCDTSSVPDIKDTVVDLVGGTPNEDKFSDETDDGATTSPVGDTEDTITDPTLDPDTYTSPSVNDYPPTTTLLPDDNPTNITPDNITPSTNAPSVLNKSTVAFISLAGGLAADTVGNLKLRFTDFSSAPATSFISANKKFNISNDIKLLLSSTSEVSFVSNLVDEDAITYSLTVSKTIVNEGETIVFTLVANGGVVQDYTKFNYALFGTNITVSDFQNNSTSGTMTMIGNIAKTSITIADDGLEEPVETVTFNIKDIGKTVAFTIASSTKTNQQTTPTKTFKTPKIGTPEVCDDGRIMEVPIISKGDPYLSPPLVLITGTGFGASAKAILDENGYLSKIMITRSGVGYKPFRSRKNCTIGQIVIASQGNGYYKEPTVFVNGKSNVARAIIDTQGRVTKIEVIDKTQIFGCTPIVEVFGGNGLGARAIPVMECRDDILYSEFQKEIAPSGTDKVIDCP
jgi:hypothetical protein